jgi:DNA-binding Xre family transcriptional regulator
MGRRFFSGSEPADPVSLRSDLTTFSKRYARDIITACSKVTVALFFSVPLSPVKFRLAELLDAAEPSMTQAELASRSGVSPTIINRMVKNHAGQVSLSTLGKLSAVLGVQPGDLIVREGKRGGRGR